MDPEGNRLLQLFGDEARERLGSPVMVQLRAREVLQEAGVPALHVYFPMDAVISLLSTTENGASVEIGLVGREGMIGLAGVLGSVEGGTSAIVQVSGTAVRVPTALLKAVRLANPSVRKALDLYIEARLLQTAQAVACSRLHPLQSRLARWLLGVHQRIAGNELIISQEFIAEMLGVHRPTVSTALQRLENEGAIVRRGRAIVIADRPRLEGLACECHRVLDQEFERLLTVGGNGPEVLAAETASRLDPVQSEPAATLEAMRDIAGRLLLVSIREQEAREQAEEANRAKDQFLAMVSHELRNPLNAILGWCTILRAQDGVPAARGLDVIAQNARAQLKLVEDLLDAARMTSATLTVHPQPIVLAEVVENALDAIRPSAEERRVDLRLTICDAIPGIAADPDRLRQVLLNVLTNSLKFTDAGGSIDVQVYRSTNGGAQVRVHDTGRGIAPDVLPHVFEQFRQGSHADAGRQGLGLGLTIAQAIVELHGGTVAVESPGLDQGTTCTIDLPLEARPRERRAG